MATKIRDTEQFKMGRRGEQVVAAMLRSLGYGIIPSYDYAGPDGDRAPSLRTDDGALPIPDLDTARGGKRRWVEIKTKNAATYTRILAQYEHGIDWDKYQRYLDVQDVTGTEIWLTFYEIDTGLVLHQSLDHLKRVVRHYDGTKMSRCGMAFFPRSELLLLGHVVPDEVAALGVRFELALDAPR